MSEESQPNRTGLFIDALGKGDIQLGFCFPGATAAVLTGIPKRQARAIANRILHEIDYAEGRKPRRPGPPPHRIQRSGQALMRILGAHRARCV